MPTPFMCHWCDKPTMNTTGICDPCEQAYEEGNKSISELVRELETRIKWLEDGLKRISLQDGKLTRRHMQITAQATLDGEPTTADEHNCMIQYRDPGDEHVEKLVKENPNDKVLGNKIRSMITSIGYRNEDKL